jgi:hypothetical protein
MSAVGREADIAYQLYIQVQLQSDSNGRTPPLLDGDLGA